MNLLDLFLATAVQQPGHPLIITARDEYTYGDFKLLVDGLIGKLKAQGVKPGDCIGLHYPNSPEYIGLVYAIWGCGACVTPIPVELNPQEKRQIFQHIAIDALLSKTNIIADVAAVQTGEDIIISEQTAFARCIKYLEKPAGFTRLNPAFVRFTSGTTGTSKGVVLSHETVYERIQAANDGLHLDSSDRIVWLLSMAYHFTVSIVAYLTYGCTILLAPNAFGSTIIQLAAKHKATLTYAAPLHYNLMAQDQGSRALPDLRLAIVTTAALDPAVAEAFYQRFQIPLNETYGIIEVGLPCMNLDKPREKRGSVGKLLPAYEARLHTIDQAAGLGEIQLRGKGLIDAYYEPWQERHEILQKNGGWFATGDLGEIDEEAYLHIRGRSKEVISVGGMKFFPQTVEAVLESHPAIQEACVFRYPDERLGEIPHAHVVKTPGIDELPSPKDITAFCAEHLAEHKIPAQITFVDRLLRTASGKLIRNASQLQALGNMNA